MDIILATHNIDKVKEFEELLDLPDVSVRSIADYQVHLEAEETGDSYLSNAQIKAREAAEKLPGKCVLADDSGLSIDALDGYPGIYSARFAGVDTPYEDKINQLWYLLKDIPENQWQAAFHCALVLISSSGEEYSFEGICRGEIIDEMKGKNGFGYDPIFYMPEFQMTTAEMEAEQKNKISHRGKAAALLKEFLKTEILNGNSDEI